MEYKRFLLLATCYSLLATSVEAGIFVISGSSRTFRSVDGTSWEERTSLPAPGGATYQDICRDALGHLYVLRSDGYVYCSTDAGKSWGLRGQGPAATDYDSIIADTGTAKILYAMTVAGPVTRSTDGGVSWSALKARPGPDTWVGIAIGRTNPDDPTAKLYIGCDDGEVYFLPLDLSGSWTAAARAFKAGATADLTDLTADRFVTSAYGFLYLLDNDGLTSRKARGAASATSYWYDLISNPVEVLDGYARFEQDLDIFSTYPQHLYALRSAGGVLRSTSAATTYTGEPSPAPFIFLSSAPAGLTYTGLSSYDALLPKVTDQQSGDDTFRNSSGTVFKVYFEDDPYPYGSLRRFETRVTNAPDGGGTELDPWRIVVDTINASSYVTNWALPSVTWLKLQESVTNFVSVRVWDNSANTATLTDVFYVLKDTTPPLGVSLKSPLPGATVTVPSIFFEWFSSTDTRSGIENYLLEISTRSDFGLAALNISSSTVVTYATTTITTDAFYYWRVRAKDKAGNFSTVWSTRTLTVNASVPAVPTGLTATAGGELVNLSWNANTEGDMWRYEIQRSTFSPSAGLSTLTYILHPGTTHQDKSLVSDNTYYYKIRAIDTAGNFSVFTSTVSAFPYDTIPPATVYNLTASTGINQGEIKLSWSMPGDDGWASPLPTGSMVKIQTSTVAGVIWSTATAQIIISTSAVIPGTTVSTMITNLALGVTYYFRLWTADERFNWSPISNGATTWALDLVPSTPTWITAISSDTIIALSWNANTEVDMSSYVIVCSSYSSLPEVDTSTTITLAHPTTTYLHSGLENGVTYYYQIKAVDRSGKESAYSTVRSTYPWDRIPPGNVTNFNFVAVSSGNQIDLSWSNPFGDQRGTRICVKTTGSPANPTDGYLTNLSTPVNSYNHTGLTDDTTYYYTAFAYDEVPNYAVGVSTSTYPRDIISPDNVSLFTAIALSEGNKINLSWSTSTIVDYQGVRIRYRTDDVYPTSPTNGTLVGNFTAPTTYYTHSNLIDDTTYYYSAWAYDEVPNYSTYSVTASTYPHDYNAPAQVTNFTVNDPQLGTKLELFWTNPQDIDFEATVIRYSTTGVSPSSPYDGTFVSTVTKPGNSYVHTGLTAGTTYYYSAFTRDEVPNYSVRVTSSGYPTAVFTPPTISTMTPCIGEQGTIVFIDTITGTNFQNGAAVVLKKAGYVDISTDTPFTVSTDSTALTSGRFDFTIITNVVIGFWTVRVTNPDGGYAQLVDGFQIVDTSAPAKVNNLNASPGSAEKTIFLTWNYTGDRSTTGAITDGRYAIQWATYTVVWSTANANVIVSTTVPQDAGAGYTVANLIEGATYFFRLWIADEIPNWSDISNGATTWAKREVPQPVDNFTAQVNAPARSINLSWTASPSSDWTGTRICASTTSYPVSYVVDIVSDVVKPTTYYLHTNLITGVTYYYRVFAYDDAITPNYSSYRETFGYLGDVIPPAKVTNLSAETGTLEKTIDLTWSVPGDDGGSGTLVPGSKYKIQHSTLQAEAWYPDNAQVEISTSGVTPGTTVSTVITGLIEGATYYFRLWTADESANYSEISNGATTWAKRESPGYVTLFISSAQPQGNTILLSWSTATIIADDFQGVRICSSTVNYPTDYNVGIVTDVLKNTTYYLDTGLIDNVTYYYKAFSYDDAITLNYSTGVVTFTYPRDTISPAAITNLTVELTWGTSVQLKWQATGDNGSVGPISSGSYWVKWSSVTTVTNGNWDSIPYATEWSTDTAPGNWEVRITTGLQSDTTWYFALKLRDEIGAGNWSYVSNCATATKRDITAPAWVQDLRASTGPAPGQINLTWPAPGDDGNANPIVNGWFYIQYSAYPDESWNRESAQLKISTSNVNPVDPQGYLVKEGLTPGVTYYFRLWTADEVPNWSTISNGATSYATIAPPAAALYPTTTTLTSPSFPSSSVKISTTAPSPASLNTTINTTINGIYYQFKPEKLGSSELASLPSPSDPLFQSGWIYDVSQIYKTLHSGDWTIRVGWQGSAPGLGVRLCYRISKVTTTISNTVELREILKDWTEDTSTQTVKTLTYYSLTVPVSSSTFLAGEYLMVHLAIKLISGGASGRHLELETNTSNEYYTTPDWRDITKPSKVENLVAISSATAGVANLTWSAPGNNDTYGQASYYELQKARNSIFTDDVVVTTRAVSGPYGTAESTTSSGLLAGVTYYFRLRTNDGAKPVENLSDWSDPTSLTLYPHTFNVFNSAPIHRRLNQSTVGQPKKDDLLTITMKNNRPSGNIFLDSLRVKFTRDGTNALSNPEAQNLFENIYLYLDTEIPDFYHYALDTSTVARKNKADFNLTDGEEILTTSTVPARNLAPGETKKYFLVVELTTSAASVIPSTFAVSVTAVSKVVVRFIADNTAEPSTTTVSYPVISSTVSVIVPAGPLPNTNWPYSIGSAVKSVPVVYWNRVYFGADNGKFYCLDSSGTTKYWEYDTGAAIRDAPLPNYYWTETEKFIWFSDITGKVYKIRDTGSSFQLLYSTNVSVAQGSWLGYNDVFDHMYVGSTDSKVYKIKMADLTNASGWPRILGVGALTSTPVVNEWNEPSNAFLNNLWIGSTDKKIYRLQSTDGTPINDFQATAEIRTSPFLVAGYYVGTNTYNLYFTTIDGKLYCRYSSLQGAAGDWTYTITPSTPIYTNPYYNPYEGATPYVYFGADNGKLYKIYANNGELVWSYQTDGRIRSQVMVIRGSDFGLSNDYVFFGSDDGYIYCLTTGGSLRDKWPVQTGAPIRSAPMIDLETKTLTIGSDDGNVYQIKIGE